MRGPLLAAGCCLAALIAGPLEAAPPDATPIFPAGAARGQTATITLGGNLQPAPVAAWAEGPGLSIEPVGEKGQFTVRVAEDCPPGLRWLRFSNADGASPPRPFVVGTLAEATEEEPNDRLRQATAAPAPGRVFNARLDKAGDVDVFSIELAEGQSLLAEVDAAAIGSPMDAFLQILDEAGFVLAQNHDDASLDPRIVFTAPKAGKYAARVFGWSSTPSTALNLQGGEAYVYRLTLTHGPAVDFAWPLAAIPAQRAQAELRGPGLAPGGAAQSLPLDEPAGLWTLFQPGVAGSAPLWITPHAASVEAEPNSADQPQEVTLPVTLSGCLEQPGDQDVFRFSAKKGQKGTARVEGRGLGFPLDPALSLLNAAGAEVATLDDSGMNRDPELPLNITADGEYRVVVKDLFGGGGPRHRYRLTLAWTEPSFALTVAETQFVAAAGKPLETTVTVDRRGGFADEIELAWEGLPAEWTAAPAVSQPKGDTAKSVKLSIMPGPAPFSGTARIVGRSKGEAPQERVAGAAVPLRATPWTALWLTSPGKK